VASVVSALWKKGPLVRVSSVFHPWPKPAVTKAPVQPQPRPTGDTPGLIWGKIHPGSSNVPWFEDAVMRHEADVLVVGAGPAGCGAAFDLCRAGFSVLLLDKESSPRSKACGGAVTIKTLRALRYNVAPVVRRVCYGFKAGLQLDTPAYLTSDYPVAAMTVRSEFDRFCLERCIQAGARFQTISQITSIDRHALGWELRTSDHVLTGRFLVAADGVRSRVRQLLELPGCTRCGFGIETCVSTPLAATADMQMDFGVVDRGYGWIFPKDDHLNVGLFTLDKAITRAPRRLADYCHARLGIRPEGPVQAGQIPCGGRFGPLTGYHNLFLVGDAAGLVDPLLGEGIYNAVRSGQIAAAAIQDAVRGGTDTYSRRLREITLDLADSVRDCRTFYRYLKRGYRHMNRWPVRYCLMKGMALGLTSRQAKRNCLLLPFLKPPRLGRLISCQESGREPRMDTNAHE
jgi:geranylgeranyl reductase family protein